MTEEQKTTQQLRLEGDNLSTKMMIRIIDYLFLFVAIRMVAVYFGNVNYGMFWCCLPILLPAAIVSLCVLSAYLSEKLVKYIKNKKAKE